MGWGSAGYRIFDPVAHALIEAEASDGLTRKTLGSLIDQLRELDWDTEHDSLDQFRDDTIIVAVFAERGITTDCRDGGGDEQSTECSRNLGHKGDHRDDQDNSWPQAPMEA